MTFDVRPSAFDVLGGVPANDEPRTTNHERRTTNTERRTTNVSRS
jgi:hypothetical protein